MSEWRCCCGTHEHPCDTLKSKSKSKMFFKNIFVLYVRVSNAPLLLTNKKIFEYEYMKYLQHLQKDKAFLCSPSTRTNFCTSGKSRKG